MAYIVRINVMCIMLVAVLLIFGGCASNPVIIDTLDITSPSPKKIPIKVGLYIPSGFRSYVKVLRLGVANSAAIGDGMSIGAEKSFKELYGEVVIIEGQGFDTLGQDIKVIISPELVEARIGAGKAFPTMETNITCKWTIVDPNGKIYYMNTITGIGTDGTLFGTTSVSKSMTIAINDHYQKLLAHMLSTKWWENIR